MTYPACHGCGLETEPGAQFCGNCGQPLAAVNPTVGRKGRLPGAPPVAASAAIPAYAVPDKDRMRLESQGLLILVLSAMAVPVAFVPVVGFGMALCTASLALQLSPKLQNKKLTVGSYVFSGMAAVLAVVLVIG